MTAGHSYGEYVALAAAGVISDSALFELSESRGRAIKGRAARCRSPRRSPPLAVPSLPWPTTLCHCTRGRGHPDRETPNVPRPGPDADVPTRSSTHVLGHVRPAV